MTNFLTIAEFKNINNGKISKSWIKKAIESGKVKIYEKDDNYENGYYQIQPTSIISLWDGFKSNFKYYSADSALTGYLGTSFRYKFTI
jgi:hypothetical protein